MMSEPQKKSWKNQKVFQELNDNESTTQQNFWDTVKAMLRCKFKT